MLSADVAGSMMVVHLTECLVDGLVDRSYHVEVVEPIQDSEVATISQDWPLVVTVQMVGMIDRSS